MQRAGLARPGTGPCLAQADKARHGRAYRATGPGRTSPSCLADDPSMACQATFHVGLAQKARPFSRPGRLVAHQVPGTSREPERGGGGGGEGKETRPREVAVTSSGDDDDWGLGGATEDVKLLHAAKRMAVARRRSRPLQLARSPHPTTALDAAIASRAAPLQIPLGESASRAPPP